MDELLFCSDERKERPLLARIGLLLYTIVLIVFNYCFFSLFILDDGH